MWLDDDTESALEWITYQDSLCSGCRNPASETLDPAMSDAYEAIPMHCHACAARDAEQRAISHARSSGDYSPGSFDGLYLYVQRRDTT